MPCLPARQSDGEIFAHQKTNEMFGCDDCDQILRKIAMRRLKVNGSYSVTHTTASNENIVHKLVLRVKILRARWVTHKFLRMTLTFWGITLTFYGYHTILSGFSNRLLRAQQMF